MEFYPTYFETDIDDLNSLYNCAVLKEKQSYPNYIEYLSKIYARKHNINWSSLVASLLTAVMQGEIKVEVKNYDELRLLLSTPVAHRIQTLHTPDEFLYNLYNKYSRPISDYSNLEFMLGYRTYLLDKFGSVE